MRMLGGLRRARGVSLLQMTVAMAIMAIMIVAATPTYRGIRVRAYIAEARYHARSWATQAWQQYTERGSWSGVSDETVQWDHPPSRHWQYGPHQYGPEGFPGEAWFVAKLQVSLGSLAYAQFMEDPPATEPDYMLVVSHEAPWKECGRLLAKSCDRSIGDDPPLPPPPPAPEGVRTLAISWSAITVGWDDVPGETGYLVEWKRATHEAWDWRDVPANTTSYRIPGLLSETTYEVRVVASNSGGSNTSSIATGTTLAMAPANFRATGVGSTWISAGWNRVFDETGYIVQSRVKGASYWTQYNNLPADAVSFTTPIHLSPGTLYQLRVFSITDGGTIPSSIIEVWTAQ